MARRRQGEKALAWVKQQNAKALAVLEARPEYKPIYARTLEILDSKEKIPTPELLGDFVYNFWKDDVHERGIWRRTTLASYRSADPKWETVLDVDALAKAEGKSWVFQSSACLPPAYTRCLIELSQGGSDAAVVREFDTKTKAFVPDGFSLPEAKSSVAWRDEDTVWVGTDFGPGSMTASGYPRIVKLWKRGTPLSSAKTIFETGPEDVGAFGTSEILSDGRYDIVTRYPPISSARICTFFSATASSSWTCRRTSIRVSFSADRFLFSLRSDWTPVAGGQTYREGSLLAVSVDELVGGKPAHRGALRAERARRRSRTSSALGIAC